MSTVADYVGRTVDLAIFQGVGGTVAVRQALVETDNRGLVVTGIEKLAQRYLMLLLTEAGSLFYLPALGCAFMADGRKGLWRTVADLQQSFYASLMDVERQLGDAVNRSDPLDEIYAASQLLKVTLSGDQAAIAVQIASRAGSARTVIQPIPVLLS